MAKKKRKKERKKERFCFMVVFFLFIKLRIFFNIYSVQGSQSVAFICKSESI